MKSSLARYYHPYEELQLEARGLRELHLSTPWLNLTIEVSKSAPSPGKIVSAFKDSPSGADAKMVVQWLLRQLSDRPVSYLLPSKQAANLPRVPVSEQGWTQAALSPRQLVRSPLDQEPVDISGRWNWNSESILRFCRIEGTDTYDCQSVYSVLRRFYSNTLLKAMDLPAELESRIEDKDEFLRLMTLVLRQNHFVTETCVDALTPAIALSGPSRALVTAFINEERGHDFLLAASLRALGLSPREVPVTSTARALMRVLKLAAGENLLAFALIVEMFETESQEKENPIANLLRRAGYEQAARPLERHRDINCQGDHGGAGERFLAPFGHMLKADVECATRLCETAAQLMANLTSALFNR